MVILPTPPFETRIKSEMTLNLQLPYHCYSVVWWLLMDRLLLNLPCGFFSISQNSPGLYKQHLRTIFGLRSSFLSSLVLFFTGFTVSSEFIRTQTFIKPEAHRPQRSPECTAMKAVWLLRRRFLNVCFFLENLAFWLPWPPIKISDLDKIHMVGRGLLQKHFSYTFVKISAVTQK